MAISLRSGPPCAIASRQKRPVRLRWAGEEALAEKEHARMVAMDRVWIVLLVLVQLALCSGLLALVTSAG
jgi:hypothetical protein